MEPYYRALFDPRTDEIRRSIRRRFGISGSNLLMIFSICLLPEHRGRGVGLATATRLIDTLGGGCSLVVGKPIASQFSAPIPDAEFHEAMRLDKFPQDFDVAVGRVQRYFARLGFRPVGAEGVYALSPQRSRPELDDVCDNVFGFGPP